MPWLTSSVALVLGLIAAACTQTGTDYAIPGRSIVVLVTDEEGRPISDAEVELEGSVSMADEGGAIGLENVSQPQLLVVTAPGHLPEPVVLSAATETPIGVRLLSRTGSDGAPRVVLHFGGDTMLGRRYLEPTRPGTPLLDPGDGGDSARSVVSSVAPLMAAADVSSVNFESVIGQWTPEDAYPGKRFLLQSPANAVAALDELGIDLVTLGNNHINDWQMPGIESTLEALAVAGIAAPGGGLTAEDARRASLIGVGDVDVGFLSYTTVTGDFVNDSLPVGDDAVPAGITPAEAWQFESRPFGFDTDAGETLVPAGTYRPGDAWAAYRRVEGDLDDATNAALWAELTAADAFPELQDWVARRGHGGAAWFRTQDVDDDIAALRRDGADLVVVQIHGGFQFAPAVSTFFAQASRAAVDGGADLVVGHHPHVLQGLEWYDGTLIAHSLGNFVFDQDFLSTFDSVVLRTVFEGDELLEARLFPVVLENYRPSPAAGQAAERIIRTIDRRSVGTERSTSLPGGRIGTVQSPQPTGRSTAAQVKLEPGRGGMVVTRSDQTDEINVRLGRAGVAELPSAGLVLAAGDLTGVRFGQDLYGWGNFEDVVADGEDRGGIHWALGGSDNVRLRTVETAPSGHRYIELTSRSNFTGDVIVRPVARITPAAHRLFDEGGAALDGAATYSLRVTARSEGDALPFVRLDEYRFVDTIPTLDPTSTLIRQTEIALDIPADGQWHEINLDLLPPAFQVGPTGQEVNAAMLYLGLAPPGSGQAVVGFDNVELIEWRQADRLPPDTRHLVDVVRAEERAILTLSRGAGG